ncbi:hypothetical protein BY458DRAFT_492795 [Sporodiniella umbellata]|nr:hypothetical protein BY458DRAFT_492795 [Sporodiniella umbellata]
MDEEEELELLRQYEGGDNQQSSSDEMDSDLEAEIMSHVAYDSGSKKKQTVEITPMSNTIVTVQKPSLEKSIEMNHAIDPPLSSASGLSDVEAWNLESDEEGEYRSDISLPEAPSIPVTRKIVLGEEKQYMDEMETSEDEAECDRQLQELIDHQIQERQDFQSVHRAAYDFSLCPHCYQPGHEGYACRADCPFEKKPPSCKVCHSTYHITDDCNSLVHHYINRKPSSRPTVAYCGACGEEGHYSGDCTDRRLSSKMSCSIFNSFVAFGRKANHKHKKPYSSRPAKRPSSPDRYQGSSGSWQSMEQQPPSKKKKHDKKSHSKDSRYSSKERNSSKHSKHHKNNNGSVLDQFFVHEKKHVRFAPTGNSNWNAMNQNRLPQPTRSGTVQFDSKNKKQKNKLPKPNKSGVIDLTQD